MIRQYLPSEIQNKALVPCDATIGTRERERDRAAPEVDVDPRNKGAIDQAGMTLILSARVQSPRFHPHTLYNGECMIII